MSFDIIYLLRFYRYQNSYLCHNRHPTRCDNEIGYYRTRNVIRVIYLVFIRVGSSLCIMFDTFSLSGKHTFEFVDIVNVSNDFFSRLQTLSFYFTLRAFISQLTSGSRVFCHTLRLFNGREWVRAHSQRGKEAVPLQSIKSLLRIWRPALCDSR